MRFLKKSESHIIKGLKTGQESAYDQLFQEYYRPLSVFAQGYLLDLDAGKEIVQDLFVHLYEKRGNLLISTSLKSYLYQSVRNRCLNYIKHQQVKKIHHDLINPGQESAEDLEEQILEIELEHRIFQIVEQLPPQCKKIFNLSRVSGFSNAEIAKQLGISKRTVETQISNALKILRKKLDY